MRRLVQLWLGLGLYGLSGALQVRAGLGLDPWDVLHQGIARHVGWQIGTVVIAVGALVMLLWWPLRQRPGVGTVCNVVAVGLAMNASLDVLPAGGPVAVRCGELAGGIVLCGVATGMYIGAHLGPGPRDGLMTGLARRTGHSLRLVRTSLELTVLAAGWALGGTVGIGTVLFAVAIGPLVQMFLPLFDVHRSERAVRSAVAATVPTDVPAGVWAGEPTQRRAGAATWFSRRRPGGRATSRAGRPRSRTPDAGPRRSAGGRRAS